MSDEAYEINTKDLDKFIKSLRGKLPELKVGILADTNPRNFGGTNAEIGAKHEFGEEGLPVRSFLRMPLNEKLNSSLENSNLFDKETLKDVIKKGTLSPWLQKVGFVAESVILEAFDTGGFGKWKPSNMKYKTVKQTLVESQQLRNSITSEVKE